MDNALQRESIEMLNQELDDVIAVRDHAMRVRWVALRGESLAMPGILERTGAHLQSLVDTLAERVLDLGGIPMEGGQLVVRRSRLDTGAAVEPLPALGRLIALLLRCTHVRGDVALAFGDTETASLFAQARRSLEVLAWHVDRFVHAED